MTDKQVWLITGAGRGMGVDIAKAALAAGHAVVATGHNPEKVSFVLGAQDDPIVLALDVTNPATAEAAVQAGVDRFGRIDVLVNNAGNFNAGFFEELSSEEFRAQIEITLFARSTSPARPCRSCAGLSPEVATSLTPARAVRFRRTRTRPASCGSRTDAPGWSSRSPRPPALWAESSCTTPRSSGWRAGWSQSCGRFANPATRASDQHGRLTTSIRDTGGGSDPRPQPARTSVWLCPLAAPAHGRLFIRGRCQRAQTCVDREKT